MALFSRLSPEEKAAQTQQKLKQKQEKAFRASPAGQARTAKEAGHVVFQYLEVLTEIKGQVHPGTALTQGAQSDMLGRDVLGNIFSKFAIEQIESEGWRMIDAGYVFLQTGSVSRDKLLSSGQQEVISGQVLGIYTFRVAANETG